MSEHLNPHENPMERAKQNIQNARENLRDINSHNANRTNDRLWNSRMAQQNSKIDLANVWNDFNKINSLKVQKNLQDAMCNMPNLPSNLKADIQTFAMQNGIDPSSFKTERRWQASNDLYTKLKSSNNPLANQIKTWLSKIA